MWLAVCARDDMETKEGRDTLCVLHIILPDEYFESPGDRVMSLGFAEGRQKSMVASPFRRPDPHEAELQGPGGSVITSITDRLDLVQPERLFKGK